MNIAPPAVRARAFDAWADDYERYRPGYPAALFELIADRLDLADDAAVVDLGAGTGKVARSAAARGWRVTAVDPGEPMLAVLRRKSAAEGLDISVVRANAEDTGLDPADFDAALAGEAYHWFDASAALTEMARIVRPGGGIAFFWNLVDPDRSPLVATERALVYKHGIDGSDVRKPGPLPETREAIRATEAFEEPEFVQVSHSVGMTGADYLGLARTKSHLRTAPPQIQEAFGLDFTSMLEANGIGASDPIELPYVVDCWIAKRRDQ
ncbi:MAG: class I SAM-dependent methyltransferase [Candidatus Limnocylindria bacterium]